HGRDLAPSARRRWAVHRADDPVDVARRCVMRVGPMFARGTVAILLFISWSVGSPGRLAAAEPTVDLAEYRADCGVTVGQVGSELQIAWQSPSFGSRAGNLVLDLRPGRPLIRSMGLEPSSALHGADPVTFLLVGTREAPTGRPPDTGVFNVF